MIFQLLWVSRSRGGGCAGSGAHNFNVQNINTAIAHRTKSTKSRSASYRRRTNKFLVTARSKKRDSHAIVFFFCFAHWLCFAWRSVIRPLSAACATPTRNDIFCNFLPSSDCIFISRVKYRVRESEK